GPGGGCSRPAWRPQGWSGTGREDDGGRAARERLEGRSRPLGEKQRLAGRRGLGLRLTAAIARILALPAGLRHRALPVPLRQRPVPIWHAHDLAGLVVDAAENRLYHRGEVRRLRLD